MKVIIGITALMAVALLATAGLCASDASPPLKSSSQPEDGPRLTRTILLSGLGDPWDLAFTPDGAMLFTEKCRGLSVLRADGSVRRLFGTKGASVVAGDFFCRGQSGMNGVAVDPDFARNRFVYVYMPSNIGTPAANRVIRLTVDRDYDTVSGRRDIVTDIPFKNRFNRWGGEGTHSGGRIRFGPSDGFLYVATGDNHSGPLPQDLTRLGGKILRVDRNGAAAPGNQTPAGGDPRIFTYGHRNVQGLAFQPESGRPFSCEHGPGRDDEVTPLVPGGNGGWDPKPEPGVDCASDYCGYISNKRDGTPTPMTDTGKFPEAMRPSWNNNGASEGMSPCVFLSGVKWQGWEGWLAVGFLRGRRIDLLKLDQAGMTTARLTMPGVPAERIRTLVLGPDQALYAATDDGEIWRLSASP